jgi:2-methylcitrate dehydratase PrpD
VLSDPEVNRLVAVTQLEVDPAFTAAYPGAQGSEVIVKSRRGVAHCRLEDVIPATPEQIRARFRSASGTRAEAIEEFIDTLERQEDVGILGGLTA